MIASRRRVIAGLLITAFAVLPASAVAKQRSWTPYERPATYAVEHDGNLPIEMRDGVKLRANVDRPASPGRFRVLVIQTPYNKDGVVNTALGGVSAYFAQRGYAVVTADVRGTGTSGGQWDSFGRDEQKDGAEVVEWARTRSWSNHRIGLFGPSYMAITQLYTAAEHPKGLKAIFPIVPLADGYRDIVFSGGQLNVSFIPFWLGLVTAGSITPATTAPTDPADLLDYLNSLASHIAGAVNFQANTIADASAGGETAYDGPFWKTRSPIEIADKIKVPTFIVGGLHDLFQRGEPLLYERLKHHVPARLLMGPWTHVGGSSGAGLPSAGVPALNAIALRWFDRWLGGKKRKTKVWKIPRVTQYVYGPNTYRVQRDWPDPRWRIRSLFLRGGGRLSRKRPKHSEAAQSFLQNPVSGICTQSTEQWTAGLGDALPCDTDSRADELGAAVYTTPPVTRRVRIAGPSVGRIWVKTTAPEAVLTVRIEDVAPGGATSEITTGWLAASFRKVSRKHSRYLRGRLLQPWHPFTKASVLPVTPGKATLMPVEIFPTRATILKGHRLRVVVAPGDFPHQLPPLQQAAGSLAGTVNVLNEPGHRSRLNFTGLRSCRHHARHCGRKKTPLLIRGF